ncbi:MAG: nitroreductase family protein [Bacteroidetes bacterium]|nr:nitroreductase family protein [Bacteroidota bacterium]
MLKDLILKNRSYRRFHQAQPISKEVLRSLVDLGRLSASGANLQPLKYLLSNDDKTNNLVFPCLAWAAYLKDWDGPCKGERPSAYIVILNDNSIHKKINFDAGISCQSILLGAVEIGLGGCMIGAIKKEKLHTALNLPKHFEIVLVVALGIPAEEIVIDEVKSDNIKYWRDNEAVHHVPKRSLDELIINN